MCRNACSDEVWMQPQLQSEENHKTMLVISVRLDRRAIHSRFLSHSREVSTVEKLFAYATEIRKFECLWSLSVCTSCGTLVCITFSKVKD